MCDCCSSAATPVAPGSGAQLDDETLIAIGRATLTDDLTQAPLAAGLELLGQAPPTWTVALTPEPMSLSDGLCIVGYRKSPP